VNVSAPTSIVMLGWALRLWYQAGCWGDPPLEAATVKHVEVLLLQPEVVLVVVIVVFVGHPISLTRRHPVGTPRSTRARHIVV